MKASRFAALALAIATLATPARSQIARVEIHPVPTYTVSTTDFLLGKKDGKRDTIAGELRLPSTTSGRLPAVILMHGGSGMGSQNDDWAQHLNGLGVATFILDSFTGRGLENSEGPGAVSVTSRIVDAYRALEVLAKHPRIDADRIAVMGFSHGGWSALYSSLKRFVRTHGPADGREFAAHIVLYPGCFQNYQEGDDVTGKPIRIFHGGADDQLPAEPCREYAARLRTAGKDVVYTEYAGAHHAFDIRILKQPVKQPQAPTLIRCRIEEGANGQMLDAVTRQPFTFSNPCIARGRTLAYDADAHASVLKAVSDFVTTGLKAK